jgi:hypothetical protein
MEHQFEEWLKDKPDLVKQVAHKLKPWFEYRIKKTGKRCILFAYYEDGTVAVDTIDNFVFGLKPEDLEKI